MNLLENFKSYLLSQKKVPSHATVKNYTVDVNHFLKWYEAKYDHFDPLRISNNTIEEFKTYLLGKSPSLQLNREAMSQASIDRHISSLRKFFQFLKLESHIPSSPFEFSIQEKKEGKEDPWHLEQFSDTLYVYNLSKLTIKNYIMDVRQFLDWAQNVTGVSNEWDVSKRNIFTKINEPMLHEYKRRLLQDAELSPLSVNRKLSSLRKYVSFAIKEGFIPSQSFVIDNIQSTDEKIIAWEEVSSQTINTSEHIKTDQPIYSPVPPIRMFQKLIRLGTLTLDLLFFIPIAEKISAFKLLTSNSPANIIFNKDIQAPITSPFKLATKIDNWLVKSRLSNVSKTLYAPLNISLEGQPFHKKLIHYTRFNRPEWYKKYHNYPIVHYFHFAVLIIFVTFMGATLYSEIFLPTSENKLLANTSPAAPGRILSFQGRLTNTANSPITNPVNVTFSIYNQETATGSAMVWSETDYITPDTNGIFNSILGNTVSIPQWIFANNSALWLGVTINTDPELTPRQQLATVAYATNAEVLQGLPPITQSGAGTSNVVLALNSSGNLIVGGNANPIFQATGGEFTLSGQPLLLTTNAGSNANITLAPNGTGFIDLQNPLINGTNNNNIPSAVGAVEVDDLFAVLATSSGQSALTINQDGTGPIISASASGSPMFTVDYVGNTTLAGDLAVNGGTVTSTTSLTFNPATTLRLESNSTLYATISNSTTNMLLDVVGGRLFLGDGDVINIGGSGSNVAYNVFGDSTTTAGAELNSDDDVFIEGNFQVDGTLRLNSIQYTFPASDGSNGYALTTNGSGSLSWTNIGGASTNYWTQANGALFPSNTTTDLLVGGTATSSAKFAFINVNSGNPTASFGGTLSFVTPTTDSNPATLINVFDGGSLSFQTSPGGNAGLASRMIIANNGNIGIGTTTTTNGVVEIYQPIVNAPILSLSDSSETSRYIFNSDDGTQAKFTINAGTSVIEGLDTLHLSLFNGGGNLITLQQTNGNGNVGIGSTTPLGKFNVNGAATGKALTILNETGGQDIFTASASGTTRFTISNTGSLTAPAYTNNGGILYTTATGLISQTAVGNNGECLQSIGGGTPIWGACGSASQWTTSGNDIYYNTGNVGIGTTTGFSYPLSVFGNSTSYTSAIYNNNAAGYGQYIYANTNSSSQAVLDVDSAIGSVLTVRGNGNVGIGSTAPIGKFNVNGASTGKALTILNQTGDQAVFTASVAGTTKFLIANDGNIGIGTTNTSTVAFEYSNSLPLINFDRNANYNWYLGMYDGSSDLGNGAGNAGGVSDFILFDASSTPEATRFLIEAVSGNVGIGSINPVGQFHLTRPISWGATGKALATFNQIENQDIFTASASGTTRFVIQNGGNVGIGTPTPGARLEISGDTASQYLATTYSNSVNNSFIGRRASGTAASPGVLNNGDAITSFGARAWNGTAFTTSSAASIAMWAGETWSATNNGAYLTMHTTATGATSSTERVRIKTDGNVGINTTNPVQIFHVYRGSDGVVARFEDSSGTCDINPTTTTLSCSSDVRLKKDIASLDNNSSLNKLLGLRSVSYKWKNQLSNDMRYGFIAQEVEAIIPELVTTNENGYKAINVNGFTPYIVGAIQEQQIQIDTLNRILGQIDLNNYGNLALAYEDNKYVVTKNGETIEERIGVFSKTIIATLEAGIVSAQEIATTTFEATTASISNLAVESLVIGTDSVTIAGQTLRDYIASIVTQELGNQNLISPIGEISTLATNIISPLSSDTIIVDGKLSIRAQEVTSNPTVVLEVQNASGSAIASIDTSGNATFSGNLQANSLTTDNASISGTLRAGKLVADDIEGIDTKLQTITSNYISSLSGSLANQFSQSQQNSSATESSTFVNNLFTSHIESNYANLATMSGTFAYVQNLSATYATFEHGIATLGPSTLSDTTIIGQLSIGTNFTLTNNSINVLGADLEIQPFRQGGVSFLSGLVKIDYDGNLNVSGNALFKKDVVVEGSLASKIIVPIPDSDILIRLPDSNTYESKFAIQNASGSSVLTINNKGDVQASGSGTFKDILANTFKIVRGAQADTSFTETIATSSAGTATIIQGERERTIVSPFVKSDSLIYITPASDTNGITPYIARQTAEDTENGIKGSFTIQIPQQAYNDIKVNWWIIN